ncbi:hypothetical protein NDU88_003525 [Pleurodeles waltl]|uniref:Uncharacterized protein n=1 Tax=Pleurodeles waltl TaxID=8319 RepID=A0AAV7TNU8_PLEWA|nr:hypothetical protein NDU88_003525 [Pleurodeles waltl]
MGTPGGPGDGDNLVGSPDNKNLEGTGIGCIVNGNNVRSGNLEWALLLPTCCAFRRDPGAVDPVGLRCGYSTRSWPLGGGPGAYFKWGVLQTGWCVLNTACPTGSDLRKEVPALPPEGLRAHACTAAL